VGVRDVVESSTMRCSLPALLMAAQRDSVISALHARFVQDRRAPIVERLQVAIAEGQISPDADADLLVDLLSGPIFYRCAGPAPPTPMCGRSCRPCWPACASAADARDSRRVAEHRCTVSSGGGRQHGANDVAMAGCGGRSAGPGGRGLRRW
jgi:hypothetical protein